MARPKRILRRSRAALTTFLETEASGGIILLVATVVAMLWANLLTGYETFWHGEVSLWGLHTDPQHVVNDGLMVLFFFVVGLEIKRELVLGELRDRRVAAMPLLAAVGGMTGPALVYLAFNVGGPGAPGWAIPMATDIAFVVGALALLGDRAPGGLKLFLLTLAIVDDIGAIAVIALFYSHGLEPMWLGIAALCIGGMIAFRLSGVVLPLAYVVPAIALWLCVLRAGVHPTLAGVALGLLTPATVVQGRAVLEDLEARLHPVSSYVVVPVFALANAGVVLNARTLGGAWGSSVFWGVAAGLVAGKGMGIFGTSRVAALAGIARRPADLGWHHLAGGAALSGIGFTVALFIAQLAFDSQQLVDEAKIGVLVGSLLGGTIGTLVLIAVRRAGHVSASSAP